MPHMKYHIKTKEYYKNFLSGIATTKNANVKINPITTKKCFSIMLNQENGKIIIEGVRVDLYVSYTT